MKFSYHDVVVFVDGVRYKPSKNYAIQLHCTKAGGWQLWHIWDGVEKKIGGEFDSESFCIEIGETHAICGKRPKNVTEPEPFGWDGMVNTDA